uniref:FK506-binding protein 4 n=1 Tax=Chaetomium thermophilum (strain DSM 1495 / CBS 144.50 / IMI 039719) TaxID=759272 RepID=FKBP4_CHATD|nr:RecName: Full=FK506-binding protein 4; AltName: Full=Histone proline isomerase; AltName: Full=Peptidyl-prolyl cis-trans isomerase; Short=PPIase; AltName: Full=Rotamase [Thermochaetoides thermophila DSM 1495]
MSSLLPVAVYGLEVPPGDILVPAQFEFPATIRITMAAIDPTAEPETDGQGNVPTVPRSTLKLIKTTAEEDDDEYLDIDGEDSEDDEESDDEEVNGGPSDPAKSKKARREAAIKKLLEATKEESDEEMEDADAKPNGKGKKDSKGKAKASESDDEKSDEDDEEGEPNFEEFVVCTLDTERTYQQPIDITITEGEKVFFVVKGTHKVYLTGNYVLPEGQDEEDDEDEEDYSDEEYDLPHGIELESDSDYESDELDEIDGTPRIKEIDTDEEEEEAPKLVDTSKKGNKKRPAEEAENLDDLVAKDKKQAEKQKKLKNNKGEAVPAENKDVKKEGKSDKKVQFAKDLEQGPSGPAKDKLEKKEEKKDDKADLKKPSLGVKVVQGVTIDDRKLGTGRTVKSGDRVSLRYIGKLTNGKVFDANKKGAPFTVRVGKGEVIKGWEIGLIGMQVGGERRLTIPPHLAYGSRAMPGIPANSTLVFDIKLLEIK